METIGLIIGVVGLLLGWWSIHANRKLAHQSGSLRTPKLKLTYTGFDLPSDTPLEVIYAISSVSGGHSVVAALPISLINSGTRAAENVKLEIVLPAGNLNADKLNFKLKGVLPGISRECFRSGELLHVYHYLPILNPRESLLVDERFHCFPTFDKWDEVKIKTKDGLIARIPFKIDYGLVFDMVVYSKDDMPLTSSLHVFVFQTDDMKMLADRWASQVQKRQGDLHGAKNQQSDWLLKQLREYRAIVVKPYFEEIPVSKDQVAFVEDFRKSQRWLLQRSKGVWKLQECEVNFLQGPPGGTVDG